MNSALQLAGPCDGDLAIIGGPPALDQVRRIGALVRLAVMRASEVAARIGP